MSDQHAPRPAAAPPARLGTPAAATPHAFEDPVPTLGQRLSSKSVAPWLFLAPVLIFGVIFFLLPLGYAGWISFTRWDGLTPPRPVGLGNYEYLLLTDPRFWGTVRNTLYFSAGTILVGLPVSLLIANAFTRARGQVVWRSVYWLPMITNVVAVAYIWLFVLGETDGLLNLFLGWLGLPGPGWLTDPDIAMISVIAIFVWMQLGHNMLLFSAGLAAIDDSYYEAARLDGATERQLFFKITIPLLKPTILFLLITNFISGLSYFALMMVLGDEVPQRPITVTALYMYQMAFEDLRYGRASAVAFILFVIILAVTLVQLRVFRRGGVEAH